MIRQHAKFEPDQINKTGMVTKIIGALEERISTPIFGQVRNEIYKPTYNIQTFLTYRPVVLQMTDRLR